MTYKIKYHYQTGGSFSTSEEWDTLELTWQDLEVAKPNLRRIKDHYQYYQVEECKGKYWDPYSKESKDIINNAKKQDWYVEDSSYGHCQIVLKTDDGKDWRIWAPWCGYFETLYGAEIETDDRDDWSFEV